MPPPRQVLTDMKGSSSSPHKASIRRFAKAIVSAPELRVKG